jgi:hypothetical protein
MPLKERLRQEPAEITEKQNWGDMIKKLPQKYFSFFRCKNHTCFWTKYFEGFGNKRKEPSGVNAIKLFSSLMIRKVFVIGNILGS